MKRWTSTLVLLAIGASLRAQGPQPAVATPGNNRASTSLLFTFQLIAADQSGKRSPEIASLDSLLRDVLKYTGYRLIGMVVLKVADNTTAGQLVDGDGQRYWIEMKAEYVRRSADDSPRMIVDGAVQQQASQPSAVRMAITLGNASATGTKAEALVSTVLTLPIGQTGVIGSSSVDRDHGIILTIRPQLPAAAAKSREE